MLGGSPNTFKEETFELWSENLRLSSLCKKNVIERHKNEHILEYSVHKQGICGCPPTIFYLLERIHPDMVDYLFGKVVLLC